MDYDHKDVQLLSSANPTVRTVSWGQLTLNIQRALKGDVPPTMQHATIRRHKGISRLPRTIGCDSTSSLNALSAVSSGRAGTRTLLSRRVRSSEATKIQLQILSKSTPPEQNPVRPNGFLMRKTGENGTKIFRVVSLVSFLRTVQSMSIPASPNLYSHQKTILSPFQSLRKAKKPLSPGA